MNLIEAVEMRIRIVENQLASAREQFDHCDANDPHGQHLARVEIKVFSELLDALKKYLNQLKSDA